MDQLATLFSARPQPSWALAARDGVLVTCMPREAALPWLEAASQVLDGPERARVLGRRHEADRDLLTVAYACHRLLLSAVLDCTPQAVPLYRDALGCPRLNGIAMHTSLSHSMNHVAIAVSAQGAVGIDVESNKRAGDMDEIAERVAHPDELAAFVHLGLDAREAALLALWVRKEAILKAAGIGLRLEMNAFQAPTGQAVPLPGNQAGMAAITMLGMPTGAVAAVAAHPLAPVMDLRQGLLA